MNLYYFGKNIFWKLIICVIVVSFPLSSNSQVKESIFDIGCDDILYGIVYEPQNFNAIGHPFFLDDNTHKATLWFNGDKIDSVFVKYDLYNQNLILSQNTNVELYKFIILNSKSIGKFEIVDSDGNYYKFIPSTSYSRLPKEIAFYELVYSNRIKYVVGRRKVIGLTNDSKSILQQEQRNFIIIDNQIFEINRKRDIYDLVGNYKKEIKQFVKRNKFRIKKNSTKEIAQVVSFYEKLLNQQ